MANFYKKSSQLGRSMIEMLGVLAIIVVLSLGSISAYSRAMFKHQLNVFAESFNTFLNNVFAMWPEVQRQNNGQKKTVLNSFFADTSQLPNNISYDPQSKYLVDVFKNYFSVYYQSHQIYQEYILSYTMPKDGSKMSSRSHEICRTAMLIAKENVGNISKVELFWGNGYNIVGGDMKSFFPPVLKTASIAELDNFCNGCDSDQSCVLRIYMSHY